MRHRRLLAYLLMLFVAYVVGLVGTIATGHILLSTRRARVVLPPVVSDTPVIAPNRDARPLVPTIDC